MRTKHLSPKDTSAASVCSTAPPIPFDDQEKQIGRVLYEVEAILANCRDQTGWRFKAIREAAERIEAVFVPLADTPQVNNEGKTRGVHPGAGPSRIGVP